MPPPLEFHWTQKVQMAEGQAQPASTERQALHAARRLCPAARIQRDANDDDIDTAIAIVEDDDDDGFFDGGNDNEQRARAVLPLVHWARATANLPRVDPPKAALFLNLLCMPGPSARTSSPLSTKARGNRKRASSCSSSSSFSGHCSQKVARTRLSSSCSSPRSASHTEQLDDDLRPSDLFARRIWMLEHFDHLFPSIPEKHALSTRSKPDPDRHCKVGQTKGIDQWFTNARRRLGWTRFYRTYAHEDRGKMLAITAQCWAIQAGIPWDSEGEASLNFVHPDDLEALSYTLRMHAGSKCTVVRSSGALQTLEKETTTATRCLSDFQVIVRSMAMSDTERVGAWLEEVNDLACRIYGRPYIGPVSNVELDRSLRRLCCPRTLPRLPSLTFCSSGGGDPGPNRPPTLAKEPLAHQLLDCHPSDAVSRKDSSPSSHLLSTKPTSELDVVPTDQPRYSLVSPVYAAAHAFPPYPNQRTESGPILWSSLAEPLCLRPDVPVPRVSSSPCISPRNTLPSGSGLVTTTPSRASQRAAVDMSSREWTDLWDPSTWDDPIQWNQALFEQY